MLLRATAVLVSLLLHGFIGFTLDVGGAEARELPRGQNILLPPVVVCVTPGRQFSTDAAPREHEIVHAALYPRKPSQPG